MKFKILLLAFALISPSFATLYCVDSDADTGGDGSSWTAAFRSLQSALAVAEYGDEIRVASGVYKPGTNREDTFSLPAGVTITGGWDRSDRDPNPETNGTILSGHIDGDGELAGNSYHVVSAFDADEVTLLDGFTITGGNSDNGVGPHDRGAGITLGRSSPTLQNLCFKNNSAKFGGGLHSNNPSPGAVLTNVSFIENSADVFGGDGGAIYLTNFSHLTFTNCLFLENSSALGGAMRGFSSDPVFTNCTFVNNHSDTSGGAIYGNNGSNITLINCIVWGNTADSGGSLDITSLTPESANNLIEGGFEALPEAVISMEDPLFVGSGNYRLSGDSPALDQGVDFANSEVLDLSLQDRFNGQIDLGPYEYSEGSVPIIQERIITGVVKIMPEEPDLIFFTFMSEFAPGTSYQPQYSTSLDGEWIDLTDASVTAVEGEPGLFEVSAPTFGDDSAFYRVIETSHFIGSLPVEPTLDDEPTPQADQLLLISADQANGGAAVGRLFSVAEGSADGAIERSLKPLPEFVFEDDGNGEDLDIVPNTLAESLSVDLTGNGMPDPIFAWAVDQAGTETQRRVRLVLPEVNGSGAPWTDSKTILIPGRAIYTGGDGATGHIRMVTLQLDDDELPEVALAHTNDDEQIHLVTIDFNGDVDDEPTFSVADTSRFFEFQNGNLLPLNALDSEVTGFLEFDAGVESLLRLAAVASDLDGTPGAELAVSVVIGQRLSEYTTSLRVMRMNEAMTALEFPETNFPSGFGGGQTFPLTLLALPLDDEPGDELLFAESVGSFFKVAQDLTVSGLGGGALPFTSGSESRRHVTYAMLDLSDKPATSAVPTLVTIVESIQEEELDDETIYEAVETLTVHEIIPQPGGLFGWREVYTGESIRVTDGQPSLTTALVSVPFDPLDLRLGIPRLSTRTVTGIPTVIVHAPPVHFDIIDGEVFDVGNMSWEASVETKGGVSLPLGLGGLEIEVRSSLGQDFRDYTLSSVTSTEDLEITTATTDFMYARQSQEQRALFATNMRWGICFLTRVV